MNKSTAVASAVRSALAIAVTTLAAISIASAADLETRRPFTIPPQSLSAALLKFSEQADIQIMTASVDLVERTSPGASGEKTAREALELLLQGTGLKYRAISEDAVAIESVNAAAIQPISSTWHAMGVRVAQADGGSVVRNAASGEDNAVESPASMSMVELEELVVTGTNIRGAKELPTPTLTITRSDIEASGYTKIEDVLRSLPQAFNSIDPATVYASGGSVASQDNFRERVTAVDLRGLGPQSTLTLLNGVRRAPSASGRVVDIGAIPLAMIERVEVVTGGRSSVYGADAVAGVVNVVTRREFEGAQTQVSFGSPTEYDGGERLQLSQVYGRDFERGGFVVAYDYARDQALDTAETGLLASQAPPGAAIHYVGMSYQPDMLRHSAMLSGRYDLTEGIELIADGYYMKRDSEFRQLFRYVGVDQDSASIDIARSEQYGGSLGASLDLARDWKLTLTGSHSEAINPGLGEEEIFGPGYTSASSTRTSFRTKLSSLSAVMDGALLSIGAITPRAAIGVEARDERFAWDLQFSSAGAMVTNGASSDRSLWSAFGELLVPFVADSGRPGLRRLELSLAARYDNYSDVGSTFNPQAGIVWRPYDALTVRGAISTAFRAPAMTERRNAASVYIMDVVSPDQPGATAPLLWMLGNDPDIGPEEAETWSMGFDYVLPFAPSTRVSLSYYSIDYDKRIDQPVPASNIDLALVRRSEYGAAITLDPTEQQIAQFLAANNSGAVLNLTGRHWDPATQALLEAFPDLSLLDNRVTNIAVEQVRGIDLGINGSNGLWSGQFSWGVNATYTLDHERKMTPTSTAHSMFNDVGKPVDLRVRASAGLNRGAYGMFLALNYVDNYIDSYSTPASRMASWTTLDLNLSFDGSAPQAWSVLRGFRVGLSVANLLDRSPPKFSGGTMGLLYDAFNANPVGRYASLQVTRNW